MLLYKKLLLMTFGTTLVAVCSLKKNPYKIFAHQFLLFTLNVKNNFPVF